MGFQRHERRMSHQYLCSIYSKWKDNSFLMSISAQNGHSHADELHSGFMGYTVHSSSNMTVISPLSVSVWVHVSARLNTLTVSAVSECVRCKSVNHSLQISHLRDAKECNLLSLFWTLSSLLKLSSCMHAFCESSCMHDLFQNNAMLNIEILHLEATA